MTELKTLKELKCAQDYYWGYIEADKELKQEAIKEIKELRKAPSVRAMEFLQILTTYSEEPVIQYIKWKFNITEEDLK